ncbi:MAG: hypothetical protein K0Q49_625 [Haloplasmataceae bacterium]|nr:hypothetical protein [Haloplasmataceae bacterium]
MLEFVENAKELLETLKMFHKITRSNNYLEEMNFNEIFVCSILINMENEGYEDAKIQVKDLSEKLKISRPALNAIINKLEDKNFVERVRIKGDRKSVYVKLTEKSYQIYYHEQEKMVGLMNNIVSKMGIEDTVKFIELLNKFYNIIKMEVK